MKQYNNTSKFDISMRKQKNIPLTRKQAKADGQRQKIKKDREIIYKIAEAKRNIFSESFEPQSFSVTNGEYLSIPSCAK